MEARIAALEERVNALERQLQGAEKLDDKMLGRIIRGEIAQAGQLANCDKPQGDYQASETALRT